MVNKLYDQFVSEMVQKQIKLIDLSYKLTHQDICRLCKYINSSIFGNTCVCWNGYISNINHSYKNPSINFYFKGKKMSLHRLLYINFVGELTSSNYIKIKCNNKRFCCSINCMEKYDYKNIPQKEEINIKNNVSNHNLNIDF
jgi:phage-related protein